MKTKQDNMSGIVDGFFVSSSPSVEVDIHYSYADLKAARLCLLLTSLWQRL